MMSPIKLESETGDIFTVDVEILKVCVRIWKQLQDFGSEEKEIQLALPFSTPLLEKVIAWAAHHKDDLPPPPQVRTEFRRSLDKALEDMDSWDRNFLEEIDNETLINLIEAADYLDMQRLVGDICKIVASRLRNKSPEEIRTEFNIENDFNPAEEDQVRKENEKIRTTMRERMIQE